MDEAMIAMTIHSLFTAMLEGRNESFVIRGRYVFAPELVFGVPFIMRIAGHDLRAFADKTESKRVRVRLPYDRAVQIVDQQEVAFTLDVDIREKLLALL